MGHLISLGHTRIGLLLGPARPRAVAPQARRAPGSLAAEAGLALGPDHIAHSLYSLEAAQAAATRLLAHGRHRASCAPATRWPWARSGPRVGPACACRTTSRSSASTTRR